MTFRVSDGGIPATVERFLRERVFLRVEHTRRITTGEKRWYVGCPLDDGDGYHEFEWAADREPSLQEAIEAVMSRA